MAKDLLRRKVRPLTHRQRKKPLSEEIASMYRVLTITLCILGTASILSYLYINSLKPAKGYQLRQLQLDYEALESENRDLERQIIDAQSISNLQNDESLEPMEKTADEDLSYALDSNYAQAESD